MFSLIVSYHNEHLTLKVVSSNNCLFIINACNFNCFVLKMLQTFLTKMSLFYINYDFNKFIFIGASLIL